jgi:hypothetical protein
MVVQLAELDCAIALDRLFINDVVDASEAVIGAPA